MKHRLLIFSLFIIYMVIMTAIMVGEGIGLAPDRYAMVLLLGSLLVKRTRNFLFDWIPFLFIIITYDFLRGLAYRPDVAVHYWEAVIIDQSLFGSLPTITLQKLFFNPQNPSWYDYTSTVLYFLHFVLPLSFGFLLWLSNKRQFREFVTGISLLSYAAWATYLLLPTAPPWLASREGYIGGVAKIMDFSLQIFPTKIDLPTIYHSIHPNPVAAIPSLHAAYPMIVLLFALRFGKLKGLIILPYALSIWISIVYLGEHYVADVLIGIFYATFFYFFSTQLLHKINWHKIFRKFHNG